MNSTLFYFTFIFVLNLGNISTISYADNVDSSSSTSSVQSNNIPAKPKILKENGKPVVIEFPDGRKAGLYFKDVIRVLESDLNLSENSCTTTNKAFCKIKLPYTGRIYTAIWLSHSDPNKVGKFILRPDYDDKSKLMILSTNYTKFPIISGWSSEDVRQNNMPMGSMECTNTDWVPWNKQVSDSSSDSSTNTESVSNIVYWDEDLEQQNDELVFGDSGPSVNSFRSRFENIKLVKSNDSSKQISISKFTNNKSSYKGFFEFLLVAYKLQWIFQKNSIENTYDSSCQIKLDNNFGKVFTEFTQNVQLSEKTLTSEFSPLLWDSPKIQGLEPNWLKEEGQWTYRDLQ